MTQTRLIIARHGNTFGPQDIVTRVGGRTDLPLVESGLLQGTKLGLHLKAQNLLPDLVVTSALKRAIQTADQAIAAAGIAPRRAVSDLFNEIDYGPDENKPEADVVARLGQDAIKAWDQDAIVPPGWQIDVQAIIQGWMDFAETIARDEAGKTVLLVTSNGIARFAPYITGDFDAFCAAFKIKLSTGAFGLFTHDGAAPHWTAQSWNVKPQ